jgi:hypothetical protein
MSYPKTAKTYYKSPFWWNEEKPWFVSQLYDTTNGLPARKRFSTQEEASEWLEWQKRCGASSLWRFRNVEHDEKFKSE